jgi:hypothetical protein
MIIEFLFLIIVTLLFFYFLKVINKKIEKLNQKHLITTSVINDLEQANLQSQLLNKKLSDELQLWKYRRKLLKDFPVSLRKKKVRGKRRKGK